MHSCTARVAAQGITFADFSTVFSVISDMSDLLTVVLKNPKKMAVIDPIEKRVANSNQLK